MIWKQIKCYIAKKIKSFKALRALSNEMNAILSNKE